MTTSNQENQSESLSENSNHVVQTHTHTAVCLFSGPNPSCIFPNDNSQRSKRLDLRPLSFQFEVKRMRGAYKRLLTTTINQAERFRFFFFVFFIPHPFALQLVLNFDCFGSSSFFFLREAFITARLRLKTSDRLVSGPFNIRIGACSPFEAIPYTSAAITQGQNDEEFLLDWVINVPPHLTISRHHHGLQLFHKSFL